MTNQSKHSCLDKRWACLRAFGIVLTLLLVFLLSGSLAPRTTDAAPPAQDQAICKLLPSEMTDKRYSTNPGICPGAQEMCFGTFCPRAAGGGFACESYLCRFQTAAEARQPIDLAIRSGGTPVAIGDVGYEISATGSVRTVIFARGPYAFSASVFTDRITSPFSQDQLRTLSRKVDANIQGAAAPAQSRPSSLNIGIGGNYDEDKDQVSVTAGIENRPGVGIGDDTYEWTLDGASAPIHAGKEQKSLQYNTASLAAGEHVIAVKVTDNVNKVSGTATFKFTKNKPASSAPPVVRPPASTSGAAILETAAGNLTLVPNGAKTQVQIQPGEKGSLKATCETIAHYFVDFYGAAYKSGERPEDDDILVSEEFLGLALKMALAFQALKCDQIVSQPIQVAVVGSPAVENPPLLAMPDTAAQLQIELQQGPLMLEMVHKAFALEIDAGATIVSAVGKNTFLVARNPQNGTVYIKVHQGTVNVQPKNPALAPFTLQPGKMVRVTRDGVSAPMAIPTPGPGSTTVLAVAVLGGASLLGLLGVFAGIMLFTRARRQSARASTPTLVAPRPSDLPERGALRKPTNVPEHSALRKPTDLPK